LHEVAFILTVALSIAQPLRGGWIEGGVELDGAQYDQSQIAVIGDGQGGAVVVWARGLNEGGYLKCDIYAQRLDRKGNSLWTPGGQPICVLSEDQVSPRIVSDGHGGYIIAWTDLRTGSYGDIYAQRVDGDGNPLWTTNGVAVCSATSLQGYPEMIPLDGGGAVIAWQDYRSGSNWDIYAQRVSNDGSMLWPASGVAVCTNTSYQEHVRISPGPYKGTNVVWTDNRNGGYDIFANYVDSLGTPNWGTTGNCICSYAGDQSNPEMVSDDLGGAIVIWLDLRNGNADVYGTRIDYGSPTWTTNGISICSAAGNQNYPIIRRYGRYGAIVAWRDERGGSTDLYAQRVDIFGNQYWAADGAAICSDIQSQYIEDIVEDGSDNLIFVWSDTRNVYNDIYAQKIDGSGTPLWDPDGVPLVTEYYYQAGSRMAPDGAGGAIVAWEDQRYWQAKGKDIYAQRLDAIGCWGYPSPEITSVDDVPDDQGGRLTIEWAPSQLDRFPYTLITHYSVWRSLSGPETAAALSRGEKGVDPLQLASDFEGVAYRFVTHGGMTYGWEWLGSMEAHRLESYAFTAATLLDSTASNEGRHHFFVASHCNDPFAYWDSDPDSGYSVDNISPCTPLLLAGEQSFAPAGLALAWAPNLEADLAGYRVYRGTTEDFVPGTSNLIAAPCDTLCFDGEWHWSGGYYYKVSAIDVHGNESGFALLRPDDLTGNETPKAPAASYLAQNFPNPFNPATKIEFGLAAPSHVSLKIYDAAGRLVRELVNDERRAGRYAETWDGRDSRGVSVASGIYFCRLDAGAFTETEKMVLIR
jgi:hypothetical protein